MTTRSPIFFRNSPGPESAHGRLQYANPPRVSRFACFCYGMIVGGSAAVAGCIAALHLRGLIHW